MLAYELYLANRQSEADVSSSPTAVKKVYATRNSDGSFSIELDGKTLQEYGGHTYPRSKEIQEVLGLPSKAYAGLQDNPGGNLPKVYVQLFGSLTASELKLSYGKKEENDYFEQKYDRTKGVVQDPVERGSLKKKFDPVFLLDGNPLRDKYAAAGLLNAEADEEYCIPMLLLEAVSERVLSLFGPKLPAELKKGRFQVIILPQGSNGNVERKADYSAGSSEGALDSFGNPGGFSVKTTGTAKFSSFDDGAFTLNGSEKDAFYQTINVRQKSLAKIELPSTRTINIAGIDFYFLNLEDPGYQPTDAKAGIYTQLKKNHDDLSSSVRYGVRNAQLLVVAIKANKAQKTVLLSYNLTLDQLSLILRLDPENRESLQSAFRAFEDVFIVKNKNDVLWRDYAWAVKCLLSRTPVAKSQLMLFFTRKIREARNVSGWIDELRSQGYSASAQSLFKKMEFCRLLLGGGLRVDLEPDERLAYAIGKTAGAYVRLKRKVKEEPNSLFELLSYAKYDEPVLRLVEAKATRSVMLSDASAELKARFNEDVLKMMTGVPLKMDNPQLDYAYFFYRGVFEELGRTDEVA